jgi:hypothetical protein
MFEFHRLPAGFALWLRQVFGDDEVLFSRLLERKDRDLQHLGIDDRDEASPLRSSMEWSRVPQK